MNFFTLMIFLLLPLSVSASILECHIQEGKYNVRDEIAGTVEFKNNEVIFTGLEPKLDPISFDLAKGFTETTRTGTWITYTDTKLDESMVSLQIESTGKVRRTYLTRESSPLDEDPIFEIVPMKCFEESK